MCLMNDGASPQPTTSIPKKHLLRGVYMKEKLLYARSCMMKRGEGCLLEGAASKLEQHSLSTAIILIQIKKFQIWLSLG